MTPNTSPEGVPSAHTPVTPVVHAEFITQENGITGTTAAPIFDVAINDDDSLTVRIDHWPADEKSLQREIHAVTQVLLSGKSIIEIKHPALRELLRAIPNFNELEDVELEDAQPAPAIERPRG